MDSTSARSIITDLSLLFLIFLAGVIYTSGIFTYLDIGLSDESRYLSSGLSISNGLPSAEDGPLYSVWYHLLHLLKYDSIELYFFNYRAMTVLPAAALFLALRASGVPRIFSIALALGLLVNSANLPVWPKVSHFALSVLLIGLALTGATKKLSIKLALLLITCLAASYARPEYFISAIGFGILFIALIPYDAKIDGIKKILPLTAMLAVLLGGSILHFGIPIGGDNRSMVAFGQHYSKNWVRWNADDRNSWTNWEAIVEKDFGNARNISDAMTFNPHAFGYHVFDNLKKIPGSIISTFASSYPLNRWGRFGVAIGIFIIFLAMVIFAWQAELKTYGGFQWIMERMQATWFELASVLILLAPSAVSVLVIYPRSHYILIPGVLILFIAAVFLTKGIGRSQHQNFLAVVLVSGLALLLIRPVSPLPGFGAQPIINTIEFLRALDIKRPVRILEAEGGYGIYVGDNYVRVAEYSKNTPWSAFLDENEINMIVLTDRLITDTRFATDQEWLDFLADPAAWGFSFQEIPGVEGRTLLYRNGLINSSL